MKKKILLVSLTPTYGGGEVYFLALVRLLKKNQTPLVVVCRNQRLFKQVVKESLSVKKIVGKWPFFFMLHCFQIIWIIIKHKVDWVHLNGNRELLFILILSLFKKIKITATRHTYPSATLKDRLLVILLNRISGAITVSQSLTGRLQELGVVSTNLTTILNAPHERFFQCQPRHEPIKNDRLKVLMVANLNRVKGHLDLIAACQKLAHINLTIVGEPHDSSILGDPLFKLGLESKLITWTGYLDDPLPEILKCDVAVLLSSSEGGCPLALMEAMVLGRPVIATRIPAVQELVADGVEGCLVSFGSIDEISKALLFMRDHPEIRVQMGERSREKIQRKFSVKLWKKKTSDFFACVQPIHDSYNLTSPPAIQHQR